jgi:hypothetical protein
MVTVDSTMIGTHITQHAMTAGDALTCGFLAPDVQGCNWFAEWATAKPADMVYIYTFGGIYGGFIYGEVADFVTISEFALGADDIAHRIWHEIQNAE